MESFSGEAFASVLALVGIVIVIAALLSGFIERSNIPQVGVFLALGAVLGPSGLGMLNVTLESPILRIVATLSLALVLFTDAVSLSITEVRKNAGLALLVLGPGTIFSTLLIAAAGIYILHLPPAAAIVLGAALASTDPVLLRGLLRRPDIPGTTRQALRLESGLNDVVLLPIVLAAMTFMGGSGHGDRSWGKFALDLFILGPGAGVLVGLLGVATSDLVRRRIGLRRDYESLYSLGIAFAAFAAAEAVHGSGFLAVFTAGLTISALDVELCDCFLEYGETTAELALLFTFVLLGASLIWSGFALLSLATALFAFAVIFARPLAFMATFIPTKLEKRSRWLISWFGPRGLSSLLLILLPVFAGLPGSNKLFQLCCLVVVVSVALHGGSIMAIGKLSDQAAAASAEEAKKEDTTEIFTTPETPVAIPASISPEPPRPATEVAVIPSDYPTGFERITVAEMQERQQKGERVILLDVRRDKSIAQSGLNAIGAVRLFNERPVESAENVHLPKDATLVAFCACPDEKTSGNAARLLAVAGWTNIYALTGGWKALIEAGYPTEDIPPRP